jgi:DNA-directed RNA polymerase III subunit RPC3
MVSQYGIKLAVYLINSYFGDNVSKVCECLLRRGTLSLALITKFTELSKENASNCLLVLIQQNCVQAFSLEEEGGKEGIKITTLYTVLFDNIIHHLRFPKFIAIVTEELGKECKLFYGLLQHGRLSLNQIIERHKQSSGSGTNLDPLLESFNKLVHCRFVERCPAHEPYLALPSEDELATKKRGKFAKKAVPETVEQRALAAAAPMESARFVVELDTWGNVPGPDNEDNLTSTVVGEKRKQDSVELDTNKKPEVLWRVNFEEFVRRLRHKACVENVKSRLDDSTAIILRAILEAGRSSETKVKTETSVAVTRNAIFEEVIKCEEGRSMTWERVQTSLVQLGCELPTVAGLDETYTIDLLKIIEIAQNHEVESIVMKRFGREAYRIFRLLSANERLLETDKISNTTFVEKKDAYKILYQLWKDRYLHMEKITTAGVKNTEFLLWKVNKRNLWEHVLDDMYHAALNLRLRLTYEKEQEKEILQLPKSKLEGELKERYIRLQKVRIVLESALMKLDDAILLFHDF